MSPQTSPGLTNDSLRPILTTHTPNTHHAVVHGVYGLAPVNAVQTAHIVLTWTTALPDSVIIHITNPVTGLPTNLFLPRDLLRGGGKTGGTRVDYAGELVFVVISGTEREPWFTLNRHWLASFLDKTLQVKPPSRGSS